MKARTKAEPTIHGLKADLKAANEETEALMGRIKSMQETDRSLARQTENAWAGDEGP